MYHHIVCLFSKSKSVPNPSSPNLAIYLFYPDTPCNCSLLRFAAVPKLDSQKWIFSLKFKYG